MTPPASALVCAGCGAPAGASSPPPFRCARGGGRDDVDHLLRRCLDPEQVGYPLGDAPNPFVRYRALLHAYQVARAGGESDGRFVARVARLDRAIAAVDGRGFEVTPFTAADALAAALGLDPGQLWVKDETGNVSGSHKARHLMGVLLALEGGGGTGAARPRLAIASCGNAALAAAVLARAAGRPLDVFVPPWAHPWVVARLRELDARLTICERDPGVAGDPCYHRFRTAVAAGAVPFCCQGPDNGLTIEGGATLAWEMIDALGARPLDRLFVQVGGGALASALALGFADAVRLGRLARAPRLHAVQTAGGHPLARAYDLLLSRILARLPGAPEIAPSDPEARADFVLAHASPDLLRDELRHAATHRSEFMWPWESAPQSLATGILDDETYDWLAVVEAMLATGGYPLVVDEETIAAAARLGPAATGIDADATGTAGLAGLMRARAAGSTLRGDTIAVIFTGARRG